MTVLSLGMSEEFEKYGISVNCLWPKTIIATAAIEFAVGSRDTFKYCRKPEIMADAAHAILTTEDRTLTGQCLIDEELLRERGITDLDHYAYDLEHAENLQTDLFIDR
jgi:short-subunit dehydrogenase